MDPLPIINLTFQTSDLAKLALFMYLSRLLSRKQQVIKDFKKGFLPIIIPVVIICMLIAPANLSTALLLELQACCCYVHWQSKYKTFVAYCWASLVSIVDLDRIAAVIHHDTGVKNNRFKETSSRNI